MCGINRNYGNPYERDSYDDEVTLSIVRLGARVEGVVRKRVMYGDDSKTPLLWS